MEVSDGMFSVPGGGKSRNSVFFRMIADNNVALLRLLGLPPPPHGIPARQIYVPAFRKDRGFFFGRHRLGLAGFARRVTGFPGVHGE